MAPVAGGEEEHEPAAGPAPASRASSGPWVDRPAKRDAVSILLWGEKNKGRSPDGLPGAGSDPAGDAGALAGAAPAPVWPLGLSPFSQLSLLEEVLRSFLREGAETPSSSRGLFPLGSDEDALPKRKEI